MPASSLGVDLAQIVCPRERVVSLVPGRSEVIEPDRLAAGKRALPLSHQRGLEPASRQKTQDRYDHLSRPALSTTSGQVVSAHVLQPEISMLSGLGIDCSCPSNHRQKRSTSKRHNLQNSSHCSSVIFSIRLAMERMPKAPAVSQNCSHAALQVTAFRS